MSSRKRPNTTTATPHGTRTAVAATPARSDLRPPSTRLRVRIQRYHGVAQWSWNANDEVCGICQTAFEGTAPNIKYPGEDCPVVWGKCGHAYHLQCLTTWLQQPTSKNSCPMCRQEWEFGQNPVNANAVDTEAESHSHTAVTTAE